MELKLFGDQKDWTSKSILNSETGKVTKQYFYKRKRAPYASIKTRLAKQLAGYALIERDLRMTREWITTIEKHHKKTPRIKKEGFQLTTKDDIDHNLTLGLFIASLTFYSKCFTQCEGRKVKLNRDNISKEFREDHDLIIKLRNNLAAHSGVENFEDVQIHLVLFPKKKHRSESPLLVRNLIQAESLISLDGDDAGFYSLVDHVREITLEKLEVLNAKIFKEEINPKGKDFWYRKAK